MIALLVHVLEQLVSGQIAARLHDAGEAAVLQIDRVPDAALPAKFEVHSRSVDARVRVAHRRQTERMVLARVLFVADTNERLLEELDDGREHLLAREPGFP